MTQAAKSQEPSMEEILASIRRIIADDDASKNAQRGAEAPQLGGRLPSPSAPPGPRESTLAPAPAAASQPSPPEIRVEEAKVRPAGKGAGFQDRTSDVLDLTGSMAALSSSQAAPIPTPGQFHNVKAFSVAASIGEAEQKAPPVQRTIEEQNSQIERRAPARAEREQLLSKEASAAIDSAFNTLAETVLVQNARTLEDLVREMLRPMLKSWLDDNLPGLVERLVRAEIERVARGR